jgi:hypothetical protein
MNTAYHILRIAMYILKYILFGIILCVALLTFLHAINPLWIEWFMWVSRDASAWKIWNMIKNAFYFVWIFVFLITSILLVINIIKEKLYKERRRYIRHIIGFIFVGPIILLPIVVFRKNKDERYKRCRLFLYIYSMWIFLYASRFLWAMIWDILTIITFTILKPFGIKP